MHFGHKSRAITLLFLNEIIPLAIPYHSSPIPMSMQSLKKIGKKVQNLEQGNASGRIFVLHVPGLSELEGIKFSSLTGKLSSETFDNVCET